MFIIIISCESMKKSHLAKSTERIKLKVESAEVLRNQSFAMAQRDMKSIFDSQIWNYRFGRPRHSSCHEVHERADVTLGLKTSISPPFPVQVQYLVYVEVASSVRLACTPEYSTRYWVPPRGTGPPLGLAL